MTASSLATILSLLAVIPGIAQTPRVLSQIAVEEKGPEVHVAEKTVTITISPPSAKPLVLARLASPQISEKLYAIRGQITYQDIQGTGYLEMWNIFPNSTGENARYFSRTLADFGMLQKISGTTTWRDFLVPFNREGVDQPPSELEFNIILPEGGTVMLRNLELVEFPDETNFSSIRTQSNAWWSETQAGWIGGIGGILGACWGIVSGFWAKAHPHRIVSGARFLTLSAPFLLLAGSIAIFRQQPYSVYFPLLLLGVLLFGIGGFQWIAMRRRAREDELRRITAMDVS